MEYELKVSVCVVTYNHEHYIEECLLSLLAQKTNFYFEILVADDCSTDGTQAIIRKFTEQYPKIVKPILHEKNIGVFKNYCFVHKIAKGKYIAHVDGDDYTLPGKLQKQADFLDQYHECAFVGHGVDRIHKNGEAVRNVVQKNYAKISDLEYLIRKSCFFAHSSKMYRRSANIYDHSNDTAFIDYLLHIEHASVGKIGYISEVLGVYRVGSGISSGTADEKESLFNCLVDALERARQMGVNDKIVNQAKARAFITHAIACLWSGNTMKYKHYIELSYASGWTFISLLFFPIKNNPNLLLWILGLRRSIRKLLYK